MIVVIDQSPFKCANQICDDINRDIIEIRHAQDKKKKKVYQRCYRGHRGHGHLMSLVLYFIECQYKQSLQHVFILFNANIK